MQYTDNEAALIGGLISTYSFEALDNAAAASDSAVPHGRRLRLLVHRVKNWKILHPGASCSAGCGFSSHDRLPGSDPGGFRPDALIQHGVFPCTFTAFFTRKLALRTSHRGVSDSN